MKNLTQLAQEVHMNMSNPHELSKIHNECAAMYSYYSDKLKDIKIRKPSKWLQIKESGDDKDISDRKADMLFSMTEDGKNEIEYSYTLKALEKIMSSIKHSTAINTQESRNQF